MVEQGLVNLVQTGLSGLGINTPGGYGIQLPENWLTMAVPQAWTWRSLLSTPAYYLNGQDPFTVWEVQIQAHGITVPYMLTLAHAINDVLSGGWKGTFTDAESTVVEGIYRLPAQYDDFADISRTFYRQFEYKVEFYEQ